MTTEDLAVVRVTFTDFEDLQTRLILLPRVEEQGVGAIVASYSPAVQTPPTSDTHSGDEDEPDANFPEPDDPNPNLLGHCLVGLGESPTLAASPVGDKSTTPPFQDRDFSAILAEIRLAEIPLQLLFSKLPTVEEQEKDNTDSGGFREEKKCETDDMSATKVSQDVSNTSWSSSGSGSSASTALSEDGDGENSHENDDPAATASQSSLLTDRLSSWTTRMRASAQLAATEAANSAASISTAVATAAKERSKANARLAAVETTTTPGKNSVLPQGKYRIFVQTSSGAFLPVEEAVSATRSPSPASEIRVTNSSLLLVRISATQSCPARGCSFQWYRSHATSSNNGDIDCTWTILNGAINAAFQPSATEVGYRLRCVVIAEENDEEDSETSDSTDGVSPPIPKVIVCETPAAVFADLPLFNGARQALVRGSQFGGLMGKGKAEGRVFRLRVELAFPQKKSTDIARPVTSGITIYQVCGSTAEPMHPVDEPLTAAMIRCDYSHPKAFELTFPTGLPESASMVSALCTEGRFQLQAPNRLARESLLLTIGIANFDGKPVDLNASTILFGGEEDNVLSSDSVHVQPPSVASIVAEPVADNGAFEHIKSDHAGQIASIKIGHAAQVTSLKTDHASQVSSLKNDHVSQMSALERAHAAYVSSLKREHATLVSSHESTLVSQSEKVTELEKAVRTLQNEKALLSAAVEARESKLSKMAELQESCDQLTVKVQQQNAIRSNVDDANRRYQDVFSKLESVAKSESDCKVELDKSQTEVVALHDRIQAEKSNTDACKSELEAQQIKIQKLIAERNSYKQKGDSLSKEIGRICKNGRTIRHVEKIIVDDAARRDEVNSLREQKHKALEDLQHYRTAFDQSRMAQKMAGMDHDSAKVLERNAELERLLSELTEFLQAKEMQLETYKQVNDALQVEIRDLAKVNMSKNDI